MAAKGEGAGVGRRDGRVGLGEIVPQDRLGCPLDARLGQEPSSEPFQVGDDHHYRFHMDDGNQGS